MINNWNVDVEVNVHCILHNSIVCYHREVMLPLLAPTWWGTTRSQEAVETGNKAKDIMIVCGFGSPFPHQAPPCPSPVLTPVPGLLTPALSVRQEVQGQAVCANPALSVPHTAEHMWKES